MIALDTNVLVRLLTRDDEKQARKAQALFDAHAGKDGAFYLSDVVLAELVWTLERSYGHPREDIARMLGALADNATLTFESRDLLRRAQQLFTGSTCGFADCLIAAKAEAAGCINLATFDKGMRGLPGVELL